jgi:hypothetical protein
VGGRARPLSLDQILSIDGLDVEEMDLNTFIAHARGRPRFNLVTTISNQVCLLEKPCEIGLRCSKEPCEISLRCSNARSPAIQLGDHYISNHYISNHYISNHYISNHYSNHYISNHYISNHYISNQLDPLRRLVGVCPAPRTGRGSRAHLRYVCIPKYPMNKPCDLMRKRPANL